MDGANVGVIQSGRGFGFALEAGESLSVSGNIFGEELESDEAMEAGVLGLVHDAHASATEFFENEVVRDGLSDERWRLRHSAGYRRLAGRVKSTHSRIQYWASLNIDSLCHDQEDSN